MQLQRAADWERCDWTDQHGRPGLLLLLWSQKVLLLTPNLYGEHSRAASTKWKSVSTVSVKIAISRRQKWTRFQS